MALTQDEINVLNQYAKVQDNRHTEAGERLKALDERIANIEANPYRENLVEQHQRLRQRGYSQQQIEAGEQRMASRHVGDYGIAEKSGLFGRPKLVIGGIPQDEMNLLLNGQDDEFLELSIERAREGDDW